ncbi:MAG TPA: AAA-like domain-containing protein [Thermotogota bacterium]|nr:AAA-like domain-containing protein [Thermotogota bacterium]HPJ89072.1 AAA-like domain-containing protein [Thermotogota bacterium]HPR95114.1 AAA-like domain-containing protein [Thermotogota bacterium]
MEKFFNTAGPVRVEQNYMIDPLKRIKKDEIMELIDKWRYFILHAPRQTGKTSSLLALRDYINKESTYKCLYVNFETAQTARSNIAAGMKAIISSLDYANSITFKDPFFEQFLMTGVERFGENDVLKRILSLWSATNDKKIILLIDEIDALIGDTLISVLRQLRSGYAERPEAFPQSVILCGVRDVRDYRIFSDKDQQIITGGSAFNIKAKSLTVGDFSAKEIKTLYEEHTKETGQIFEEKVFDLAWEYTKGQPWLVNALAYEVCFENKTGRDRTKQITTQMYESAKRKLILRRDTHIDQLADKLKEERVRRVIEPMLAGEKLDEGVFNTDIEYCKDLGLIKKTDNGYQIANAIYREVIPRELGYMTQLSLESIYRRQWYVEDDGKLNMMKLLKNFQQFFREQSESWLTRFKYEEAGPQLLIQAFLQRVVNGGGQIDREYGLGRKRTDLYIRWPIIPNRFSEEGKDIPFPMFYDPDTIQKVVIELKLKHNNAIETVIDDGLEQTAKYVDKTGAKEAYLIIFDQDNDNWDERIFVENRRYNGVAITIFGM